MGTTLAGIRRGNVLGFGPQRRRKIGRKRGRKQSSTDSRLRAGAEPERNVIEASLSKSPAVTRPGRFPNDQPVLLPARLCDAHDVPFSLSARV